VYPVIAEPCGSGALQLTSTDLSPGSAWTPDGASGALPQELPLAVDVAEVHVSSLARTLGVTSSLVVTVAEVPETPVASVPPPSRTS
jgi:hypothetical protein